LTIFGDLKYPATFQHFEYVNPDAPKGGSLRLATLGSYDSLNAYILKGEPAAGLNLLYDTLLQKSYDEPFSAYGLLAERVELAADRSSVTFRLRKQAKWHDGSPITAADVVFTFDTLKKDGHPFYQAYYHEVTKAEALNPRTVRFTFASTQNRELPLIIGEMPVLPKQYYTTHPFAESTLTPPLGSGPYKVAKVDAGRSIQYARVPDYWAKDLPVMRGRYNFDRVRYDYYRDETVMVEALKAGEYDARQETISRIWATAYKGRPFDQGVLVRNEIMHEVPSGMQGFVFNTRRPMFADPALREAMNYAFDFEWENKTLFYGAYSRTTSYFSNSSFAAEGVPSAAELKLLEPFRDSLPPRLFTEPHTVPVSDGGGVNRINLLKAKHILDKAGWKVRDGLLRRPGTDEPVVMQFLIASPPFERAISPYLYNLKKLGITASIRMVDQAQYQRMLDSFNFDITMAVFGQSSSPGNEQKDYWHSSQANVPGTRNIAGVAHKAVDALVERIVKAESLEELQTACRALDRVLLWNFYVIPNWFNQSYRMVYWDKFGRPSTLPKYDLGLVDTWWEEPAKAAKVQQFLGKGS
jgi:microcin C transport system substrate-binding protein